MRSIILSLILALVPVLHLAAEEFHVDKDRDNKVKFISDAPIEEFEGVTDYIDGYVYYEGGDLTNSSALYFEVDLNSIDTGIGLRNRHMRENYLETDKKNYRFTHYNGKIIEATPSGEGTYDVVTEGNLFIHGQTNKVQIRGTMHQENSHYHIHAEFEVKLSDYKIKIPSVMFYKIDENMQLILDFYVKEHQE
ncbi:MAG: YceI family protein [Caldithrix sp.]|nr:YceI family protein [Caldithrix sp.]